MKTILRAFVIFVVALILGMVLEPRASELAAQTGHAFAGRAQNILAQVQVVIPPAPLALAARLTGVLTYVALALSVLILYLMIALPIHVYGLERRVRRQQLEMEAMRNELRQWNDLLREAKVAARARREKELMLAEASRSRVDRFIFPQGVDTPANPRD